jgi:hypothetical protein
VYHPLNKITCPPLNKLNDLARLTLQFSLTQTLNLPEEQIRQRFIQHFSANGYPNAGSWLWGKDVLVRQHVMVLISKPVAGKQDIYLVYLQNQEIENCFQNGVFNPVPIPPVTQEAYTSAAELARNFYKILCDGVPHEKINEIEDLDRQIVLRAYLDAQRKIPLKVCPGCDGKPPSIADGIIHEDLDHFFPKSKYPFLSIHPLNLTPFCKDCNQTYKKSKDAILDNDPTVADVHVLTDIYHPYQCPSKDQISLSIQTNPDKTLAFRFTSNSNAPQDQARLNSLQYILNLESRWTGDLLEARVEEELHKLLLYGSENERNNNNGFQPDQSWLVNQLTTAVNILNRKIGHEENHVKALSYITWVKSDPIAQNNWLDTIKVALANQ